ncbi:MAG: radical SAM protein [bacterium]|nr:MAG: radical SAM protein [bacterium]
MKILLVNPPVGFSYYNIGIRRPPLGLAYLAALLRDRHDVTISDFSVAKLGKIPWKKFPYSNYDVVGISVDTARYPVSLRIARLAKEQGATVVMGGPHVSFMDQEALESGVVDYVVRNEGEYSFSALVDFLAGEALLENAKGISYLSNGTLTRAADMPFIEDLDSLPFPARELLPLGRYNETMNGRLMTTLVTSRGCPFNCKFCASSEFFGVHWRARSVDSILEEVDSLYEQYGYRALCFTEDNFTLNSERAIELSERLLSRGRDLIWEAWSRVDTIVKNPKMVRTMARSGFKWTFLGFESGSQEVLDGYGKKALAQDALRAMEILDANDVRVTGAFILGATNETGRTIKETINFAKALNPSKVQFSILTPYPGTELYERTKDRLLTNDWGKFTALDPVIRLDHISPWRLGGYLLAAYASFYLRPKKAVENIRYIVKTFPGIIKFMTPKLYQEGRKYFRYVPLFAKKLIAGKYF